MIQIRNVPPSIHRKIKARAAMAGMSMSDFILREITRVVQKPTLEDVIHRISREPERDLDPTAVLRRERDGR